jgi:hypothetical protein
MSQIRQGDPLLAVLLLLVVFSLAGCGSANDSSSFNPDSGSHPAGWLPADHMTKAVADMESCAQCHGADYAGGISGISCSSCHLGGVASVHPVQWNGNGMLHRTEAWGTATIDSCRNIVCHGPAFEGVYLSGGSCLVCHKTLP